MTWCTRVLLGLSLLFLSSAVGAQEAARQNYLTMMRGRGWQFETAEQAADPNQRLLLLLPDRALLVELHITIDGRPFRVWQYERVAKMLAHADRDGDGVTLWDEAFEDPKFLMGQLRQITQAQARDAYRKSIDFNDDGIVQLAEAQYLCAQRMGGPSCMISPHSAASGANPKLYELLDSDSDAELSAEEIEAAPGRLRRRDRNDDELLEYNELVDVYRGAYRGGVVIGRNGQPTYALQAVRMLIALDEPLEMGEVTEALNQQYGETWPERVRSRLNAEADDAIDGLDLARLREMEPDVRLRITFGEGGASAALEPAGGDLAAEISQEGNTARLVLAEMQIEFVVGDNPYGAANWKQQVDGIMNFADTDKNGYIEKKELEESQYRAYARQFETWDADGDGKAFREEIESFYREAQLPMNQKASIAAGALGRTLFPHIDADGDGRLSALEIASSAERLQALDTNGDGRLGPEEVPAQYRLGIARGNYVAMLFNDFQRAAQQQAAAQQAARQPNAGAAERPLDWFTAMDSNRDGAISRREFLGRLEQFERLDADGNGFLERSEAVAEASE